MDTHKITLKLVRSFSLGFSVHSPTLNGLCFDIYVGCFTVSGWSRGRKLIGLANYWR